jgi:hypothetical protein
MEVWGGSEQATTQEWDDNDVKSTVPGSVPDAAVQIGDMKSVVVVFLASPEEFCVQVTAVLVIYYVLFCIIFEHSVVEVSYRNI